MCARRTSMKPKCLEGTGSKRKVGGKKVENKGIRGKKKKRGRKRAYSLSPVVCDATVSSRYPSESDFVLL